MFRFAAVMGHPLQRLQPECALLLEGRIRQEPLSSALQGRPLPKSWRRALRWINEGAQASRSGNPATEKDVVSHGAAACPSAITCGMPINPERRKQLRTKALEHLEAARACLDETGDGVGNYLVERAIDE